MPPSSLPGNRSLRIGLAGYGVGGRQFHVPALVGAGLGVAALATANPERVAQARSELPVALVVPDLDALLEVDGLDLVVLATPTGLHAAQAERVIEAGVALVVDKGRERMDAESMRKPRKIAAHRQQQGSIDGVARTTQRGDSTCAWPGRFPFRWW